jgi:hypothetical protein
MKYLLAIVIALCISSGGEQTHTNWVGGMGAINTTNRAPSQRSLGEEYQPLGMVDIHLETGVDVKKIEWFSVGIGPRPIDTGLADIYFYGLHNGGIESQRPFASYPNSEATTMYWGGWGFLDMWYSRTTVRDVGFIPPSRPHIYVGFRNVYTNKTLAKIPIPIQADNQQTGMRDFWCVNALEDGFLQGHTLSTGGDPMIEITTRLAN